jgi:predicted RNA methylase
MEKLFSLSNDLTKIGIQLILIQIDEAHSSAWPLGLDNEVNPHKCFQDRIDRANLFAAMNPPYNVYIDGWDNEFAETFQAWPDREYFVTKEKIVLKKASYDHEIETEENDACVVEEYTDYLEKMI